MPKPSGENTAVCGAVIYHTQKGESYLNYTETLRNRVILGSILKEYKKQGVSVDVESLVQYIHVY